MNNPLIQKVFKEVILHLTRRGPIKEVLVDALLESSFVKLDELAVTPQYRDSYKRVFAKLTKEQAKGMEATFVTSIEAMSEEDAQNLAEELVSLGLGTMVDGAAQSMAEVMKSSN